ncbi:hypothetical protein ANN_00077 [Periplaneta americana]|uniref:C2H2-type domain-containing protein n=1 Tax=Periplaneta americana TaxID=6978 RepID=A0ABQ8TRL5_PERAM|nr:hypothetical protein ANN_00077 [Periplaneta americana]
MKFRQQPLTVVLREDGKYSKEKSDTDSAQAEEKVICLKCRQEFSSAAYLTYHLKMHERGRVYVCEICDKGFPRKYLFDRHYLKCAWDPMHCATCDRAFFCRQHLIKHCRKCKQQNEK